MQLPTPNSRKKGTVQESISDLQDVGRSPSLTLWISRNSFFYHTTHWPRYYHSSDDSRGKMVYVHAYLTPGEHLFVCSSTRGGKSTL